jgi:RNA polymerase sigma-70 factor (ECF subfamily)
MLEARKVVDADAVGAMDDDPALVQRARDGNPEAFRALVERYHARVVDLAAALTGDADLADDVAQEVFVKVHRGLGRFRGDAAFSTWLYRVTTNQSRDANRSRSRRRTHEVTASTLSDEEAEEAAMPEAAVESFEGAMEARELVALALGELPEDYRAVLWLKDGEGRSYEEIAGTLGRSTAAVRNLLYRARMAFRAAVRALEAEGAP